MMIYASMLAAKAEGRKQLAVLIDPDKVPGGKLEALIAAAATAPADFFLVGGSLLVQDRLEETLRIIREICDIPRILFPGNNMQVTNRADGILLLSLISGRNPDLLIGQHVVAAPYLRQSGLEVIPTGYMLIDGGVPTSVSYMSNTTPIPADKEDIALCTAMAGEMLGLRLLYLDAGSGAHRPVEERMIRAVSAHTALPLIVGGGIRTPERALAATRAGADLIVIGNAIEKNPQLVFEISAAVRSVAGKKV